MRSIGAVGVARAAFEISVTYAKERETFGAPIATRQAIAFKLADMAIEIEPTRPLYWYAAHAFDHIPEEFERSAALAKAHVTDCAMQIGRDSVEAHGGIGYTWECDVQFWIKR